MDLLTYARIKPVANQIEINPLCAQDEVVRFLLAKEILPIAFCPLSKPGGHEKGDSLCPKNWPNLTNDELLLSIGKKYNKTPVQVMLNWGISRGYAVAPKATSQVY